MAKIRLKDLDEVLDNFEEAGLIEEVRYKGERFTRKTLPYERKNGRFENFIVTNIEFNYATGANVGRVRVRLTHKNYTDAELNVWLHQIYKEMKQQGSTVYIDIWDIIRRGKR